MSNEFYEKFSKSHDIASGVQRLINNFMMMRQFREAQESGKFKQRTIRKKLQEMARGLEGGKNGYFQ